MSAEGHMWTLHVTWASSEHGSVIPICPGSKSFTLMTSSRKYHFNHSHWPHMFKGRKSSPHLLNRKNINVTLTISIWNGDLIVAILKNSICHILDPPWYVYLFLWLNQFPIITSQTALFHLELSSIWSWSACRFPMAPKFASFQHWCCLLPDFFLSP